ncbi:MAG: threonylcarbamoyl-AMP synthase [Deltaproteobacteria bacterium]|nr:threonylcarbamoyl-AMP synthase [Deltaproteobacteria bacterium]
MSYGPTTELLQLDPTHPDPARIAIAVEHLRRGHVVAYPTETFYGLGVDFQNERAIKRLYELKRRDPSLPIALLVADLAMLEACVTNIGETARTLMTRFWPGPLTLCLPASAAVSRNLTTNTGKIGVRISPHPIAAALVHAYGRPITTTSANRSGYPPSLNARHIQKYFPRGLDCIIDGGECQSIRGSTVVDLADDTMAIVRDGAIGAAEVTECFQEGAPSELPAPDTPSEPT